MDEMLLKDISKNMEEKSTEELLEILKENNKEEWSEEAFESMRRILVSRGQNLPKQSGQESAAKGLEEGSELRGVVFAGGISRKTLNIMAVIGLFIFGWLITIAFDLLGKGKQGWMYFKALIATLMISKFFVPPVGWLALVIYITACIHANFLLSRYKKLATERLAEFKTYGENNINVELEKGLILCRVLKDKKGVDVLRRTLQTAGGDASLLNLAGVIMSDNKKYKEAAEFFDRALTGTNNEVLIKQLKQNRAHTDKKMAKYLKGERMKNIILLLTIVSLVLAVGGACNVESQSVTTRSRGSKVTANRLWQCPKCGTILEKRGLGKVWDPGDPITRVAGNATCGKCTSLYDQADVYGGMYDVEEKTKQEELPGFDGTVSIITYQLLSTVSPNNSRAICEDLLKKKYPKAKLGEFYCIGRADDNLTPDEGLVQYKEYVRNGTIPEIGTQFGTLQGNDITGKKVVVLFFKK